MIIADEKIKQLIADIAFKSVQNGITFTLSKDDAVIHQNDETKTACAGFFCGNDEEDDKQLVVATGKPIEDWLPILLHEASHMDQYLENAKVWQDVVLPDGTDAADEFFKWFGGKDHSNPAELAMSLLYLELDCEKRTVDKIIQYNLTNYINPREYIQKSNSYVYFYLYCLEIRDFYKKGKAPYMIDQVWKSAPDHFEGDYTVIPDQLKEAFKKCL